MRAALGIITNLDCICYACANLNFISVIFESIKYIAFTSKVEEGGHSNVNVTKYISLYRKPDKEEVGVKNPQNSVNIQGV